MGNGICNINSIESMLDALFDRTVETEQKIACCSCFIDNKKYIVPELGEEYSAEAVWEKDSNMVQLTIRCSYKKSISYEHNVEVGMSYDDMFSELYQFLYPDRIALLIEDIRNTYEL